MAIFPRSSGSHHGGESAYLGDMVVAQNSISNLKKEQAGRREKADEGPEGLEL